MFFFNYFFFILTDLNNKQHVCIIDVLQCNDTVTFISFRRFCFLYNLNSVLSLNVTSKLSINGKSKEILCFGFLQLLKLHSLYLKNSIHLVIPN